MNIRIYIYFLIFYLLFAGGSILSAQSTAEEMESLLSNSAVTYAQAARFILEASDVLTTTDHNEAFQYAADKGWLPKKAAADTTARLDGISLLFMKSFNMKGGIFYSITKNPHYAYREMTYRSYIQGRTEPSSIVSGDNLLFITGRILSRNEQLAATAIEREKRREKAQDRREALAAKIRAIFTKNNINDAAVRVTDEGVMIILFNIQFLADSAAFPESELYKLKEISNILKDIPGRHILIAGHTAMAGSEETRLFLSLERAKSVAEYLIKQGVRTVNEITTVGYGGQRPVADNSTPEGMAANRRVEIIILEN